MTSRTSTLRCAVSRRTALSGAVAALTVSACSERIAGPSTAPGSTTASPPAEGTAHTPDQSLLADLLVETVVVGGVASATGARHRALRGRARALAAIHRKHARLLAEALGSSPGSATAPRVPGRAGAARRRLDRAEASYVTAVTDAAARAEDGATAALLASMAAAVCQHQPTASAPVSTAGTDETLAAEYAAAFVLAALGARVSESANPDLADSVRGAWETHRARAADLAAALRADGEAPVAAETAYDVPDARTPADLAAAAAAVERAMSGTYAAQVSATQGAPRAWAVHALVDSAQRAVGLGAAPVNLPGLAPQR